MEIQIYITIELFWITYKKQLDPSRTKATLS